MLRECPCQNCKEVSQPKKRSVLMTVDATITKLTVPQSVRLASAADLALLQDHLHGPEELEVAVVPDNVEGVPELFQLIGRELLQPLQELLRNQVKEAWLIEVDMLGNRCCDLADLSPGELPLPTLLPVWRLVLGRCSCCGCGLLWHLVRSSKGLTVSSLRGLNCTPNSRRGWCWRKGRSTAGWDCGRRHHCRRRRRDHRPWRRSNWLWNARWLPGHH
mmetsp:Transcript_32437/g.87977  ORF Transcript_32437/g.87977 Transcript_32437/m.87977 type:complete len:218 (+) Transcript_32437:97-750(+)